MSRFYKATPLWGLSRKSAVAGIFFKKISRLHIVRISALRWTEFYQNRKDPIREIQRFLNLGHNLCETDKQTLHGLYLINYEIHLCILGIVITDGALQVSKTL